MMDFRLAEVSAFIEGKHAKSVALQFPEGLKVHAMEVAEELERRTGCSCIILGDPCYGACDFAFDYERFADVLVHFGHSEMPSLDPDPNVLFVEVFLHYAIIDLLPEALPQLKERIGLITTVQHIHQLEPVKVWLEEHGKKVWIGKGDGRIKHSGQVLGCNVSSARSVASAVEQYLYLGSGDFHPLAVSLETGKGVIVVDPLLREVRDMEALRDKILRQRHGAIALAQTAQTFGIIVSSKIGQRRSELAQRMVALLQERGKKACLLIMDNVSPEQLLAFQVDAFVSTACPRLAIDDYMRFKRPMLTPLELEVALGLREWADYSFDSILD
jgi:2-(3-amino-3-carboxypropyl)histidine synthase